MMKFVLGLLLVVFFALIIVWEGRRQEQANEFRRYLRGERVTDPVLHRMNERDRWRRFVSEVRDRVKAWARRGGKTWRR